MQFPKCFATLLAFATFIFVSVLPADAGGSVRVRGYYRKDGTYVRPHYRSAPDGIFSNNWSTKGNINPFTGEEGTRVSPPGSYVPGLTPTSGSSSSFPGNSFLSPGQLPVGASIPGYSLNPSTGMFNTPTGATASTPLFNSPGITSSGIGAMPLTEPGRSVADWVALAEQSMYLSDFKNAVLAYGQAIALDPSDQMREKLALAYCQLARSSDTQASIPFFHRSMGIWPNPSTQQFLSDALKKSKRDPNSYKQRLKAAEIAGQLNDPIGSIVECKEAVRLAPDESEAHLELARAYAQHGLHSAALNSFDNAVRCGADAKSVSAERQRCETLKSTPSIFPRYYFVDERN